MIFSISNQYELILILTLSALCSLPVEDANCTRFGWFEVSMAADWFHSKWINVLKWRRRRRRRRRPFRSFSDLLFSFVFCFFLLLLLLLLLVLFQFSSLWRGGGGGGGLPQRSFHFVSLFHFTTLIVVAVVVVAVVVVQRRPRDDSIRQFKLIAIQLLMAIFSFDVLILWLSIRFNPISWRHFSIRGGGGGGGGGCPAGGITCQQLHPPPPPSPPLYHPLLPPPRKLPLIRIDLPCADTEKEGGGLFEFWRQIRNAEVIELGGGGAPPPPSSLRLRRLWWYLINLTWIQLKMIEKWIWIWLEIAAVVQLIN